MSLRWSLSSLSQVEGLRDGTHPLAARTCEPRPLAQARQIRPAAPVGAKDWGPADRSLSRQPENGVGRFGGQAGTRSPTLRPHHRNTSEAGPEALSTSSLPNRSGSEAAAFQTAMSTD